MNQKILILILFNLFSFSVWSSPSRLENPLVVVIDPGHGGNDQGTSVQSASRLIKESDLTLKLSQKILRIIQEKYSAQINATVTRDKNKYVPLQKRVNISNAENVDFYLSLHYNSAFSQNISGSEFYFPEDNRTPPTASSVLETIKQDLVETGRIKQSLYFLNKLAPQWKTAHIKIRRAPFYVLEKADAPALLIEVGYLTNPLEQKSLLTETNQDLVAESIVKALMDFKETRDKQLN